MFSDQQQKQIDNLSAELETVKIEKKELTDKLRVTQNELDHYKRLSFVRAAMPNEQIKDDDLLGSPNIQREQLERVPKQLATQHKTVASTSKSSGARPAKKIKKPIPANEKKIKATNQQARQQCL